MPVFLATQEAEIRRLLAGSKPGQTVLKPQSGKKSSGKMGCKRRDPA
jgi:hypothetical protein